MAEQTLTRRSESKRVTMKMTPLPPPRLGSRLPAWLSGPALVALIAVGGAIIGSIGSQVVARLTQGPDKGSDKARRGGIAKGTAATERIVEIEAALQGRDFASALLLAEEGMRYFPGEPQFQAKRKRADEEIQNRFRYQTFQLAISRQNYQAALALFDELPVDSSYKFKATQELKAVREQYIAEQLHLAQAAARLSQCDEARAFATSVLSLDNTNRPALSLISDCTRKSDAAP